MLAEAISPSHRMFQHSVSSLRQPRGQRRAAAIMSKVTFGSFVAVTALMAGCAPRVAERTDREVYQLINSRQVAALGAATDANVRREVQDAGATGRMYSLNPRPVDAGLPESFHTQRPDQAASEAGPDEAETLAQPPDDEEMAPSIFPAGEHENVTVLGLGDALAYAMRHGRDLQDAKEDLYLAALDLTLERHLWTPQFVANVNATYTNFPEDNEPDRAMQTVADVALTQRLPSGGEVSAQVIHTLMRDVFDRVAKGETGQAILSARVPLLRGAGQIAYESRYAAERELIYAVRRYERFRRSFLVEVAARYFDSQLLKAGIANTFVSYQSRLGDSEQADFEFRMGRRDIFDTSRAKTILRDAEASLVSAKERYETALDRFKIFIGMPVDTMLDVVDQEQDEEARALDALLPDVDEATAAEVALRYRLDLLNRADQADDTRRGVAVAKNRLLPDLDLTGSLTLDSDPNQLRASNFREERRAWEGGIRLNMDDRKTERNAYRAALVSVRRADRELGEFTDAVVAEVRRALRRIGQQEQVRVIRQLDVKENELRLEAARAQYRLGRITNQDVVDAENDLLAARNQYAVAIAAHRVAILEFRRDTGTLRISDDGRWETPAPPRPDPITPDDQG